jgi:hypothetical protein
MADNTSFCSCGCEEKLKFIQTADSGMKMVTVCMSWTLVNRYSAFLGSLYVWYTRYLKYWMFRRPKNVTSLVCVCMQIWCNLLMGA